MTPPNQKLPSTVDLARQTREHLAEIRVQVLSIASEYEWDEEMAPKIQKIETSLAKVFRGINALLKIANSNPEAE